MEEHPAIKTADQVPVGWFERYVPSLSEFVEVIELASFYTPIDPALLRLGEVYEVRIVERYGRVVCRADGRPYAWFLDGKKSAPGWKLVRVQEPVSRKDYCPRCRGK